MSDSYYFANLVITQQIPSLLTDALFLSLIFGLLVRGVKEMM